MLHIMPFTLASVVPLLHYQLTVDIMHHGGEVNQEKAR